MPEKMEMKLTIVSHYGKKSVELINLISMLQDKLSECLGFAFKPYDMEQVHGTIIGLEGVFSVKGIVNKWFKENRDEERYMKSECLLEFIKSDVIKEIGIKIGGYHFHKDYGFTSREQHPFMRSFSIQGKIAVTMGWPIEADKYVKTLYQLRKNFEQVEVLHKWHKDGYEDNDFFFVLGRIDREYINPLILERMASEIRLILAGIEETVTIGKNTMSIVAYIDPQLPTTTSGVFRFNDESLTPQLINHLYQQSITMRCT